MNILYIEDDAVKAAFITREFERHMTYVHLDIVTTRQEALERLEHNPDGYELVLMGRFLPVRNGATAIEHIRERLKERESPQRLLRIIEEMPLLFDAFDEDGTALFWNKECERVTGYSAEEIVGNPRSMELLVPDAEYRSRILGELNRLGHSYRNWEIDICCKHGESRTISWSNMSRECPVPGWWSWGVGIDVTDRIRAEQELRSREEELRQNEARYKKAQEMGHVGNWEFDPDTSHFWGSDEAKRLYGFDPDENDFSTEEVEQCIPERKRVHQSLIDLIEQDTPYDLEFEIFPRNGRPPLIIHSKAELLRNADGAPVKVVGVVQDITARKRAEEALKYASEGLQQMVEEQTSKLRIAQEQLIRREKLAVLGQMAGSVGHELRSPLATISNAVYYLKLIAPEADAALQEYLEIIAGETRNAEKIIHDLLDFARVKTLKRERIDFGGLIDLVRERWKAPDNVQFLLELPDEMPEFWADRQHLEQVMLNLLTNACEAMPQGGTLTVSARQSADSNQVDAVTHRSSQLSASCVLLTVQDTGCGIPASQLEKLFEPLFTTKAKGTGLGLAISKNLIEANGGRLTVESKEDHGSTFCLIFPLLEEQG